MTTSLHTNYLGLSLPNPLIAAASPLTSRLSTVCRLARAGVAAVVLPSIFEEQLDFESQAMVPLMSGTSRFSHMAYANRQTNDLSRPQDYLKLLESCCAAVEIPIFASLNGVTPSGWLRFARQLEEAGASAIELNFYSLPCLPEVSSTQVECRLLEVVGMLVESLSVPLAVKLSPYYTSLPHLACALAGRGATGLVLFNRLYQPDFCPETLRLVSRIELSRPEELRLPLTWAAILADQTSLDLSISGGVHSALDVVKSLMVGARTVQIASRLIRDGPEAVASLLHDLSEWMQEQGYASVEALRAEPTQRQLGSRQEYRKIINP